MTELERHLQAFGQGVEKGAEHFEVYFKIRRQLKQNRTKLSGAGQWLNGRQKTRYEVFGALQPLDVSNDLVRLHGETEVLRRIGQPLLQRRFLHQLPKGKVHLNRVQLVCVMAEKFCLRQFLRIKIRLP